MTASAAGLRLLVYQQSVSACWQDWHVSCEWLCDTVSGPSARIHDVQWLDESPAWGLPTSPGAAFQTSPRPGLRADGGAMFAVVLESSEFLLGRLASSPADATLLRAPLQTRSSTSTAVVPLAGPMTESRPGLSQPGHVGVGSHALGVASGTSATADIANAAIGFPPLESTVLVAIARRHRPTCRPHHDAPVGSLRDAMAAVEPAPLPAATAMDDDAQQLLADLDAYGAFTGLGSLGSLEEAFGDLDDETEKDEAPADQRPQHALEPDLTLDGPSGPADIEIKLYSITVSWSPASLAVETLGSLPFTDGGHRPTLRQLVWLRRSRDDHRLTLLAGSQAGTATHLRTWRSEHGTHALCGAFDKFRGKQLAADQPEKTWIFTHEKTQVFEDLELMSISPSPNGLSSVTVEAFEEADSHLKLLTLDLPDLTTRSRVELGVPHATPSASGAALAVTIGPHVKLMPSPGFPTDPADIGALLALDALRARDSSDVIARLATLPRQQLKQEADLGASQMSARMRLGHDIIEACWSSVRSALKLNVPLERTVVAPDLLRVQHAILRAVGDRTGAERAHTLLRLLTVASNFEHACTRSRVDLPPAYNIAMMWSLIAQSSWYIRCTGKLLQAIAETADERRVEEAYLLVHPLALASHCAISKHLLDFAGFVSRYPAPIDDPVMAIARDVLITAETPGAVVITQAGQLLLASLSSTERALPPNTPLFIRTFAEHMRAPVLELLDKVGDLLALTSANASISLLLRKEIDAPYDAVTYARLGTVTPSMSRRVCLRCRGISDVPQNPAAWADGSLEATWRTRCFCGGQWSLVASY